MKLINNSYLARLSGNHEAKNNQCEDFIYLSKLRVLNLMILISFIDSFEKVCSFHHSIIVNSKEILLIGDNRTTEGKNDMIQFI